MKTSACVVGDIILIDKIPKDYSFGPLKKIIGKADARLFNLESVVSDESIYASSYCGGVWLISKEARLEEALEYGFNGCSFANNHTMDFSYDGLFSTMAALKKKGVPFCGAGKDLESASGCTKVETENGSFGMISICSTFNDAARAGAAGKDIPGRPGLNPLRFSTVYEVTPEHAQALREIAEATCMDGRRNRSRKGGYTPMPPEGTFGFGDFVFRESETEQKLTAANPTDIARTTAEIKKALKSCDTVFVLVHSHEIKHNADDEPDDFFVEFAHACIEAGANAVIGTGTHQIKAVEMYRGRPIFYSLGNFVFQSDSPYILPPDYAEKYNMPAGLTAQQQILLRNKNGTTGLHTDVNNFRSLMPFMTFDNGELTELCLYPIRLDMKTGLPMLADENEAKEIFRYLEKRNEPYGTNLILDECRIRWEAKH